MSTDEIMRLQIIVHLLAVINLQLRYETQNQLNSDHSILNLKGLEQILSED